MNFCFGGLSFQTRIVILLGTKPYIVLSANLNCNYKKCFYKCICFYECIIIIKIRQSKSQKIFMILNSLLPGV